MREVERKGRIETYLVERGGSAVGISDDELADAIREELTTEAVDSDSASLDRYLRLVPDLERRVVALDAAIDVVLRKRSHGGPPDSRVVEELSSHYPHLAGYIRDAAALYAGLMSSGARGSGSTQRELPSDFGPLMPNGFPRYRLLKQLGQGAHGEVFLAEDRGLEDREHRPQVAIKLLAGGHRSERARQRLMDEATKARRVNHPNVVRVFDRGVSVDGEDFIVYEYVPGGTLDSVLTGRSGRERSRDAAKLIAQVARGVQAAHHAGLVHCDLKPGNILIAEDGSPKVADFGVSARVVDPSDEVIRGTAGGPLGNLAFIAPEQFREEPGSVAIPADLYALGGLLFYALTGELPNGSTAREIAERHSTRQDESRDVARVVERQFDADLGAIVRKALADTPEERFSSAAEFAADLERWVQHRPVMARSSGLTHRARLWAKRRPAFTSVIVLSVLCCGGLLTVLGREYRRQSAYVQSIVDANQLNDRMNFGANLLPALWLMEQINSVSIMGRGKFDEYMYTNRFKLLRTDIDRAHELGRDTSVMTLIWEVTLAHWVLLSPDRHASISTMLKETRRKWADLLEPEDEMLDYVDMLLAVSVVRDHWFPRGPESSQEPIDPATLEEVAESARVIEAYVAGLADFERYSPAHLLAARALKHAYSGKLLDQRADYVKWSAEVKQLEHGHLLPRAAPKQRSDSMVGFLKSE